MKLEQPEIFVDDIVEVHNPFTGECIGKNLLVKQNPHSSPTPTPLWVFLDQENSKLISTGGEVIVIKQLTRRRNHL